MGVLRVHVRDVVGPVVGGDVDLRRHAAPLKGRPAVDRAPDPVTGHDAGALGRVRAHRRGVTEGQPAAVIVMVGGGRPPVPDAREETGAGEVVGCGLNFVRVDVVAECVVVLYLLGARTHHVLDDVFARQVTDVTLEKQRVGVLVPAEDLTVDLEHRLRPLHPVVHERPHDLLPFDASGHLVFGAQFEHRPDRSGLERLHRPSPYVRRPRVVGKVVEQRDARLGERLALRLGRDVVELNDQMGILGPRQLHLRRDVAPAGEHEFVAVGRKSGRCRRQERDDQGQKCDGRQDGLPHRVASIKPLKRQTALADCVLADTEGAAGATAPGRHVRHPH